MEKKKSLYLNRFSTCAHVFNVIDKGEPTYSRCVYGAIGHINQRPDIKKIEGEVCTICKNFSYRETIIKTIQKDNVSHYIDTLLAGRIKAKKEDSVIKARSHLYMELSSTTEKKTSNKIVKDAVSSANKKPVSKRKDYLDIV